MRFLRNVYGEPPPLLLHPRLRLLRLAHIRVRFAVQRALRRPCTPPAYLSPEMAEEQDEQLLRACANFMGARGGNADQREAYKARAIDDLLTDPTLPADREQRLRAAGAKLNPKPIGQARAQTEKLVPGPVSPNGDTEDKPEEARRGRTRARAPGVKPAAAKAS